MKPSVTITFTVLFLAVWVIYERMDQTVVEQKRVEVAEFREAMKLLNVDDADSVTGLKIQRNKNSESFTLAKENGAWWVSAPVHYPADSMMVDGLVTALNLTQKVRKLKKEKDWSEYGLQNPVMKIGVRTQKISKEKVLCFGDNSPLGNLTFARWEDEEEYFLLSAELKAAFSQSLYTLRLKQIFSSDIKTITRVAVKSAKGEFELAKHKDKWFWMEPIPILGEFVPASSMEALFNKLLQLNVKEFKDEPFLDPEKFGMVADGFQVTVAADEKTETLLVGREEPSKEAYFAKQQNLDAIFLVSSTHLNEIFDQIKKMADQTKPGSENPVSPPAGAGSTSPQASDSKTSKDLADLGL